MLDRDNAQMLESVDGGDSLNNAKRGITDEVRKSRRVGFNLTSEHVSLQGLVLKDEPIKIVDLNSEKPLAKKKSISKKKEGHSKKSSSAKGTPKLS